MQWDRSHPRVNEGDGAALQFLLFKQIGRTFQFQELSLLSHERVLQVSPSSPAPLSSPPAPILVPLGASAPPLFLLPKQSAQREGTAAPCPGQRHSALHHNHIQQERQREKRAGKDKEFCSFFTRMSDVPRCPNPRPGCVYPRTSLLFCANQTRAGYTLTPSRDKAAQGTGSSPPVTSSAAKPRSSQPEHGEFLPAAGLGSGCSTTPALLSSAALHRVPAGGRARRAAAGTRHHPEPSLPGLDTGFTGDSLIRHPVLQHSCSLTSGGPDQNALLAVIKPCAGCWRWVLPHALPRSRFLLFRGLGHWVPQLGAGPHSLTALSIQIVAGTE